MIVPEPRSPIPMTREKREKIRRESKFTDTWKNMPFKFSKPKRIKADLWEYVCEECGRVFSIGRYSVLVVCGGCGELIRIEEANKILRW